MLRTIAQITKRWFCDLDIKNKQFVKKMRRYEKDMYLHQKASKIDDRKMADFVVNTPR
jgi:hypothetical protein